MRTAKGTYRDPVDRSCFEYCPACRRCAARGTYAKCVGCSGRPDEEGMRVPHPDDFCTCSQGVMRWVTQEGELIIRRYKANPYKGTVKRDAKTQDERDWNAYLKQQREKLGDPDWDPIQFTDGSSTSEWLEAAQRGR